jgi:hypothetical protein
MPVTRAAGTPAAALATAALFAAVLALVQVGAAEWTGVTTLTDTFFAGGDRYVALQMSLVAWFCAVSTVIAATSAAHRFGQRRVLRRAVPVAAAIGTLAVLPLIAARANDNIGAEATRAAILGAVAGAAACLFVSGRTRVGVGVAVHAALVWAAGGLTSGLVWYSATVFAGMVEFFELDALEDALNSAIGDYAPEMLPFAAATSTTGGGARARGRHVPAGRAGDAERRSGTGGRAHGAGRTGNRDARRHSRQPAQTGRGPLGPGPKLTARSRLRGGRDALTGRSGRPFRGRSSGATA